LLPYANAVVQHYQPGFQSGNEYNIQTPPLFIDFNAAYYTIIRNEVYISISELSFPTKLIRLTAATLNTVLCCLKIQNDCSEYFETRQGLRQGDVLSTLIFNIVLKPIVRRAKLQTNGTVFNKQTQILGYADDIDIIGRNQAAVRELVLSLEREAAKVGVKIDEIKTKYIIATGNERKIRNVGQCVAFGDETLEVVKEFVYLGSVVTPEANPVCK
jgi:Reverse transcriptase (RNA-dependent DNA polymerase)